MSYEKQNFVNGQVLTASHLNHIESGIESAETTATAYTDGKIATEVSDRNAAIATEVNKEKNNRQNQCNTIQYEVLPAQIAAEASARDTAISNAIGAEVTNRNLAISSAISTEETNRNEAISQAMESVEAAIEADIVDDRKTTEGKIRSLEGAVSQVVATFHTVNLFNYQTIIYNKGLSTSTGKTVENSNFACSDFIGISENGLSAGNQLKAGAYIDNQWSYACVGSSAWAFYDANYDFLTGQSGNSGLNTGVTIPEGAVYFRFAIRLEYNSQFYPVVPFFVVLSNITEFPDTYMAYERYAPAQFLVDIDEKKVNKSEVNNIVAGASSHLVTTTGVVDQVPYTKRVNSTGSGHATVQKIIGGTVNFNQLIKNADFSAGTQNWSYTNASNFSVSDGIASTGIAEGKTYAQIYQREDGLYKANHVIFSKAIMKYSGVIDTFRLNRGNSNKRLSSDVDNPIEGTWYTLSGFRKSTDSEAVFAWRGDVASERWSADTRIYCKNTMSIDLTRMFGPEVADAIYNLEQASEGAGVKLFREMFPLDYYSYDEGTLKSVKVYGRVSGNYPVVNNEVIKSVNFNQLAHMPTSYPNSNQTISLDNDANTTYTRTVTFNNASADKFDVYADHVYLMAVTISNAVASLFSETFRVQGGGLTIGSRMIANGLHYTIGYGNPDVSSHPRDIYVMITDGLSTTCSMNVNNVQLFDLTQMFGATVAEYIYAAENTSTGEGLRIFKDLFPKEYYEYTTGTITEIEPTDNITYQMDDDVTLFGAPVVVNDLPAYAGDEYTPDGKVTRKYRMLDLSSLNWSGPTQISGSSNYRFGVSISVKANTTNYFVTSGNYTKVTTTASLAETDMSTLCGSNGFYIRNDSCSTVEDLQSALLGVYLIIESSTPYSTFVEPYESEQIAGDAEEFIGSDIPVGHVSLYQANLGEGLETLLDPDVAITGATPTIVAEKDKRYICGTITSLSFTPCSKGICSVRFTTSTTVSQILTGMSSVKWPTWFNPDSLATNSIYELNILDGVYGAVGVWAAT